VHVDDPHRVARAVLERVLDARRHEHERPGRRGDLPSRDDERQLAVEYEERVVLAVVGVRRRAVAVRRHRDDREVEPRGVLAQREELHVADPQPLAGADDRRF
jgi:hypothetical protein